MERTRIVGVTLALGLSCLLQNDKLHRRKLKLNK